MIIDLAFKAVSVKNIDLLSVSKKNESDINRAYRKHIKKSPKYQ